LPDEILPEELVLMLETGWDTNMENRPTSKEMLEVITSLTSDIRNSIFNTLLSSSK
jgi:hypothetical protein